MSQPSVFLHPFASPNATDFVNVVKGEGCYVEDDRGRRYVDALASLWYCNVGHGREEMVTAISEQLRTLDAFHTFDRYTNPAAEDLCAALAAVAPFPDARVFLTCSGSEAVDSAVKLARWAAAVDGQPQRTVVISRTPSYHGVTYGGASLTGLPDNHLHFGPMLPDVVHVPYDDLDAARRALDDLGERALAVIAEPVVGGGGVHHPPPDYFPGLAALCRERDVLLVSDEVICGFGRLGEWWGATYYGYTPDLITFAKGVTSGYQPLGGVILGPKVTAQLRSAGSTVLRHGHTYSGHPTACAAGLAALAITRRERLLDRARAVGERLDEGLKELSQHPAVAEVRGAVAIRALGLAPGVPAVQVRDEMLARGVIARHLGESTLAVCPPLVIEDGEIDVIVAAARDALDAVAPAGPA